MLGLYVSDHPLMGLEGLLGKLADKEISELHENDELPDGAMVSIAGLITSLTRKTTKQGNLWAIAQIEDLAGSIEVLFFPPDLSDRLHHAGPGHGGHGAGDVSTDVTARSLSMPRR